MSFWTVLKKIGAGVVKGVQIAEPIIQIVDPSLGAILSKFDPLFAKIITNVVTVEANNPVDGQGQIKSNAVIADFEAGLATTQSVLALEGKKLVYDDAALQKAITDFANGYNGLAAVKTSFKIVPLV